jgi:hypothetical protein
MPRAGWSTMKRSLLVLVVVALNLACSERSVELQEVRSNWKFGPEFRDRGRTHLERWTAQTGLDGQWSNGWRTGVEYRNRSNNGADGYDEQDHAVWLTVSFPIWKSKKTDRVADLEKRIERLEKMLESRQE